MNEQSFWCIFADDVAAWWSDAEEITARDADEAAADYVRDFGDGDESDCDEVDVIVASDQRGTDAKRIAVVCYVERSYSAGNTSDDVTLPPRDESEPSEIVKGAADDQTLSLFID